VKPSSTVGTASSILFVMQEVALAWKANLEFASAGGSSTGLGP
jgi:hypothetical protein